MLCFKYGSRSWLRNLFVSLFIVIRNGKIVWKHGPYCWYYRLNLKYPGWPYRAYIKTAKNGGSCEELLSENDFEAVLTSLCSYDYGVNVSRAVSKIATDQRDITNVLRVIVCWIAKIYQPITMSITVKRLVTRTSLA